LYFDFIFYFDRIAFKNFQSGEMTVEIGAM
jgi:hypothetical protein